MKYLAILIVVLSSVVSLQSQDIEFHYDAVGNRVQRVQVSSLVQEDLQDIVAHSELKKLLEDKTSDGVLRNEDVALFPNPTRGLLQLAVPEGHTYDLMAYSQDGRLLKTWKGSVKSVDINSWQGGVYYFVIRVGDQKLAYKVSKL